MELFAGQLAILPIFRGLTPLQVAAIARRADRVTYTPGATMVEEDTVADAAILIVSGKAMRVSGPQLITVGEPIMSGSLIGEAAMLIETNYGCTVVARNKVRSVHIRRDSLHELILQDRAMADRLMQNLSARLAQTAEVLRRVDTHLAKADALAAHQPAGMAETAEQPQRAEQARAAAG
ncbi:cAMP-binding protein [Hyphomicrobium sulfonivorans]|uniref:cAMP-binding protein n=1 Tax=Hyphomicrobium sulfonivorans TaxID=121290 RepID=A0A109BCW1_HYPSL|nr:cyclic nucleotide-binding domain-containing protein [Hyphomicrobium sulfonivorans]KWT66294.1 cAMP-binding protein [Hyphomicrobium sulfonivorans]